MLPALVKCILFNLNCGKSFKKIATLKTNNSLQYLILQAVFMLIFYLNTLELQFNIKLAYFNHVQ